MADYDNDTLAQLAEQYGTDIDTVRTALEMQEEEAAMPRNLNYRRESGLRAVVGDPSGGDDDVAAMESGQVGSSFIDFAAIAEGRNPSKAAPVRSSGFIDFAALADDGESDPSEAPTKKRTGLEVATDTFRQIGAGVNNLGASVSGLIDPSSDTTKMFKSGTEYWNQGQSEVMKGLVAKRESEIASAAQAGEWEAFKTALGTALAEPAIASKIVFETLPSMLPVLGAGKAATMISEVAKLSPKAATWLQRGALAGSNAALTAGDARGNAYDDLKETYTNSGLSPEEAHQRAMDGSRTSAAVGAGFGLLGGAFGAEAAIMGKTVGKTATGRAATAFGAEVGTELGEEVAPLITTNTIAADADGRPWSQNVGRTAADTMIGVGPMATMGAIAAAATPPKLSDITAAPDVGAAAKAAQDYVDAPIGESGDAITQAAVNLLDSDSQQRENAAITAQSAALSQQNQRNEIAIAGAMDQASRAENIDPLIKQQASSLEATAAVFPNGTGLLSLPDNSASNGKPPIFVNAQGQAESESQAAARSALQARNANDQALTNLKTAQSEEQTQQPGPTVAQGTGGTNSVTATQGGTTLNLPDPRPARGHTVQQAADAITAVGMNTSVKASIIKSVEARIGADNMALLQQYQTGRFDLTKAQKAHVENLINTDAGGQSGMIVRNTGESFKTVKTAELAMRQKGLQDTHQVIQVADGFAIQQKPAAPVFDTKTEGAPQQQARDNEEGRYRTATVDNQIFPDVDDAIAPAETKAAAQAQPAQRVPTSNHKDATDLKAMLAESGIDADIVLENVNVLMGKTRVTRGTSKVLNGLAKILGKRIVFYSSPQSAPGAAVKASKDDNRVWINVNDTVSPLGLLGHETLHKLEQQSPEAYKALRKALHFIISDDQLVAQWKNYYSAEARGKMADAEIAAALKDQDTRDHMIGEMLGDLAGNRFAEVEFWQQVFEKIEQTEGKERARGLIAKLKEAVILAISRLQAAFKGGKFEADQFLAETDHLEAVRRALSTAYAAHINDVRAGKIDENAVVGEGGARFSRRTTDFTDPEDRKTVSTTVPKPSEKKGRTSNPITEKWVIDTEDMRAGKNHIEAAVAAISQYNTVLSDPSQGEGVLAELRKVVVDNLLKLHDMMPEAIRQRARLWYDGANRIANDWTRIYGITDRQAAGVLAVFSPQMDWFKNVSLGERAILIAKRHRDDQWSPDMTSWVSSYVEAAATLKDREDRLRLLDVAKRLEGKTFKFMEPSDQARFVRVFDETYHERNYNIITPEGGFGDYVTKGTEDENGDLEDASVTWGSFATIEKALSIIYDGSFKNISEKLGNEHKVRNFYNNIIEPNSADGHVTIDTHAIAAALWKALSGKSIEVSHNFGTTPTGMAGAGQTAETGASGTYGLFADAYREAAAQRGILAREMQSITWEAVRSLFPAGAKKQMQPKVDKVWDKFKAGEITRQQAEDQVMEISGGLRPMQWEGTPEGRSAADGGVSFNHTKAAPRTLSPANTKEKVTVSMSAYTDSIPALRQLRNMAAKGDAQAHALLQNVALDAAKELMRGTSAKITSENATGLYGGATEPSLQVTINFNHAERNEIIARLKVFAETFNQEQVHVLRKVDKKTKPGHHYADGSYATAVYRWDLKQALSTKEIAKVIKGSNLYGLTFGDTFITAYFVNQPGATKQDGTEYTEEEQLNDFITNAGRADVALGEKVSGTRRETARLWPYGDRGSGAIGWPGVPSGVSGEQGIRAESVRVAKQYINGLKPAKLSHQRSDAVETLKLSTPRNVAEAWQQLAEDDGTFSYSIKPGTTLQEVIDGFNTDHAAGMTVKGIGAGEYRAKGVTQRWRIEIPRSDPAILFEDDKGRVWLDASALKSGVSRGSMLYALTGNYAYNAGKVFIGDPGGLSDMAVFRRTEHMLSLALKYKTTRHIGPGMRQLDPSIAADLQDSFNNTQEGDLTDGYQNTSLQDWVDPLTWEDGNDGQNLESLVKTSYANTVKLAPEIRDVTYNRETSRFEDRSGKAVDFEDLARAVGALAPSRGFGHLAGSEYKTEVGLPRRKYVVGGATMQRGAITKAILDGSVGGNLSEVVRELRGSGVARKTQYSLPRNALPNESSGNRTIDGAELTTLRRAAADLERPDDGVFLRVTEDGRAIATGPKGTRVPETFRRFAEDNDLVFTAGRIVPRYDRTMLPSNMDSGITKKSEPMPIIYRESGALYFGEMGETIDRTDKTRFSNFRAVDTESAEFKRWFGASQVLDEGGEPRKMYHATFVRELNDGKQIGDITEFNRRASVELVGRQESMDTVGVWFSDNPSNEGGATMYASGEGAAVYPVYLNIRRPKYYATFNQFIDAMHIAAGRDPAAQNPRGAGTTDELRARLKADGYDGILFGKTYTKQVMAKVADLSRKVADAKDAEWAVSKKDRARLTERREKLEQQWRDFSAKLKDNESTEFDDQQVWVAFEPEQIKSATTNTGEFSDTNPDIRFSLPRQQPWYYSALEDGIKSMPAKVSGTSAANVGLWLKSNADKLKIKKDEIQWSGVLDYLAMRGKDKITADELAEWVVGNGVKVQDVVLGEMSHDQLHKYLRDNNLDLDYEGQTDAEIRADLDLDEAPGPKFAQYVLPGGENYKELLITLPDNTHGARIEELYQRRAEIEAPYIGAGKDLPESVMPEWRAVSKELAELRVKQVGQKSFRSSHFDQPNILAHIRMNERTDASGAKVLFLEELQSDWGQKGKKEGFDTSEQTWSVTNQAGNTVLVGVTEQQARAVVDREGPATLTATQTGSRNTGIPSAPFVTDTKSWTSLAIKRAIAYAVDNGFDKIAWTTGEQQAERYDLSKQIDKVEVYAIDGGLYNVEAYKGGKALALPGTRAITAAEMEDVVGKDLAQKAVRDLGLVPFGLSDESRKKTYSGLDLKVGGEGMKGFYDMIVPSVAKKLGAEVGVVEIPHPEGAFEGKMGYEEDARLYHDMSEAAWGSLPSKEMVRLVNEFLADEKRLKQPGFPITTKMREQASGKGMALFSTPRIVGNSGRQYTPEQQAMFTRTGREVSDQSALERLKEYVSKRWVQGIFDQFAPIKDISKQAYTLMRLSRGASGALEAFLKHGKLSIRDGTYDADTTGGAIDEVFVPLGKETTDFLNWIAGHRAERLTMEGKERLFSPQDIAAAKSLDKGTADFDYTLRNGQVTRDRSKIYADSLIKFNEFNKNVMDMAEQSGLIDGSARKLWESEFYVPFYRVMEDENIRAMGIKKGVVRQQAFKKLKGGEEKLGDLLQNTLLNWHHLIDASAKNRAAKAAIEAAQANGVATLVGATMGRYASSNGAMLPPGTKGTVWFMEGGYPEVYQVDDPAVMEAINGLQYAGLNGPLWTVLTKPKHWLTIGVTASPFFKVRNLIRDSVQAIATSDLSYNAVGNVIEGYKLTNRDRQEYISALAGGGLIRFGTMLEGNEAGRTRQLIRKGAKDANMLDDQSAWGKFYTRMLEPGIEAYNELGNRGEEINRMSLYHQLIKQGQDHATASLMARDLMDFSSQGSFETIRILSQIVPFFNARMQGMYKLGRASKENRAHMATVIFTAALASLALMALAAGDDDKWNKWKKREEWDKASNWWFEFGGVSFRIPKPFELGTVSHIVERTVEGMFDSERDAGKRTAMALMDAAMNQLSMNPVPQAFKPIIDLYANKDSFTKRPIEGMAMQRLDPQERYNSHTTMPARWLSNATGGALSPLQYDHLVRSYFGWMGATSVGAADLIARGVNDEPTRPALDYFKFSTGGIVREDETGSRYVSMMYDQFAELEQAHATYTRMRKEGKVEEAKEYKEDNEDKLKAYRSVANIKKRVASISERIRLVERSSMHPAEKRIKLRELKQQQSDLAAKLSQ